MGTANDYNYTGIDSPYDNSLERSESILPGEADPNLNLEGALAAQNLAVSDPSQIASSALEGESFENLWIGSWIKSKNYQPKARGFLIDGLSGYIECRDFYASNAVIEGTIQASAINIPDADTTSDSFHVAVTGDTWWGCTVSDWASDHANADAYILKSGDAAFSSVHIHGRSGQALADAINASAILITDLINVRLDTSSKKILSDFNFGTTNYAGAVKAGSIAWNTSTGAVTGGSGVVVYRKGIVGANAGSVTFSIDATNGNATFAGAISASTVTSTTITGGTVQTASSGQRVVMASNKITIYNAANAIVGVFQGLEAVAGVSYASSLQTSVADINLIAMSSAGTGYTVGTSFDALVVVDVGDLTLSTYHADTTGGDIKFIAGASSDIVSFNNLRPNATGKYLGNNTQYWSRLYLGGTGYAYDNGGALWYNGSPVGSGSVTSVATSGAITGGTITTSGTISHLTSSGYKHVPSGGSSSQFLKYSSDGSATWAYLGGSNVQSLYPGSGTVYLGNGFTSTYFDYGYIYYAHTKTLYVKDLYDEDGLGYINLHDDLFPSSSGTYNLGTTSKYWYGVSASRIYVDDLYDRYQGYVESHQDFRPSSSSIYDLGSSSYYWDSIYVQKVYLQTGYTYNPSSSGQILYYDGSTKGFRGYINGWKGQFDLSGVL